MAPLKLPIEVIVRVEINDAYDSYLLTTLAHKVLSIFRNTFVILVVIIPTLLDSSVLGRGQRRLRDERDNDSEHEDAAEEPEIGTREADGVDGVVHEVVEGEREHQPAAKPWRMPRRFRLGVGWRTTTRPPSAVLSPPTIVRASATHTWEPTETSDESPSDCVAPIVASAAVVS